jgi:hypothetical protein
MKGYNIPDDVSPLDEAAPWNQQEASTKKITVYVHLSGVIEQELEVPADLDITDRQAVENAMDSDTVAPWGRFFSLTLGDIWQESKHGRDPAPWYDLTAGRAWLEGVEE